MLHMMALVYGCNFRSQRLENALLSTSGSLLAQTVALAVAGVDVFGVATETWMVAFPRCGVSSDRCHRYVHVVFESKLCVL